MAYIITDEDSTKGRDPNINIIHGIHNIRGKTSVNVLVSNFTNKHNTFNKGEYVGHLKPAIEDNADSYLLSHAHADTQQTVSPPNKGWQNKLNQILFHWNNTSYRNDD